MQSKIGQTIIDLIRGKYKLGLKLALPSQKEKANTIKKYAKKYGCKNLVETGTYLGDTIEATKKSFEKLYTIELGQDLHERACKRFEKDTHVKLYQGDSSNMLPEIIKELDEKTLFWLDGHYSEGITAKGEKLCPILEELDAIYNGKKLAHVLLIDDARHFGVVPDYPSIDELSKYILSKWAGAEITVKKDIIRVILN